MTLIINRKNKMTIQKGKRGNPKEQKTDIVTDSRDNELQIYMTKIGLNIL
jgi:hypothetical protein